jgi:hypothetical protein
MLSAVSGGHENISAARSGDLNTDVTGRAEAVNS